MARLEVRTVEGITLELDVAGPGTRFAAGILDAFVIGTLLLALMVFLNAMMEVDPTGLSAFARGFFGLGFFLFVIAYHVGFHALGQGRTPGKRAMGIGVVGLDGQPAGIGALTLRGVLMGVDILPLPLCIGVIVIALTPNRQRLGDLLAGTLVVRDARPSAYGLEPWSNESWSNLQVRLLNLTPAATARFDRQDLSFLRDVITRRGMEAMGRRGLLEHVARHYRERLGVTVEEDPRAVIRELYLFLREHRGALREAG